MMELLSQWLERIILLVLFATFLEVILPNSSMQRYVKLVMGLMILLSILTPIMQLFQKNLSPEKIAIKIMNYPTGASGSNLKEIKDYGEKLMKLSDQDTIQFVQKQMESLIKAKVEEQFGIGVLSVKVSVNNKELDKLQEYPVISAVQLVLDKDIRSTNQRGESQNNIEIKPVEPVTINVSQSPDAAPAVSTTPNLPNEQRKMLTDVAQYVAQTWSIDQTRVQATLGRKNGEGKG